MKNSLFALALLLSIAAFGQSNNYGNDINNNNTERIIDFHSDIIIEETGIIKVTEQITVYANGNQINHGIRRQLPLYREDNAGNRIRVEINQISVLCNDEETKYHTENDGGNLNIYIGDRDVFLSPGVYKYTIAYETPGQIGFFDNRDELYWNVTGNGWDFNIEKASASITLPKGTSSITTDCYTGMYKSTEKECACEGGNIATFHTSRALNSNEGFTVNVSFPRDIIKRPPPPTPAELFWNKYKRIICGTMGLLLFGCYFFFTWEKVGKDPAKPTVIPQFKPPKNMSPAVVRYLYKKNFDDKIFTVTLIAMAVKKAVSISNEKKKYSLNAIEEKETLVSEERTVYESLFSSKQSIEVNNSNQTLFSNAIFKLKRNIKPSWNLNDYFHKNQMYALFGAGLAILIVMLYGMLIYSKSHLYSISPRLIVFIPVGIWVAGLGISIIASKRNLGCGGILMFFIVIGGFFIKSDITASNFIHQLNLIALKADWVTIGFILSLSVIYAIYVYLIKAPTALGAQTESDLEGFKMYLETAEEDRLNLLMPPEKTPELFEKLLPYAFALDVENEWCKKFDDVLKQFNYQPDWYTGSGGYSFSSIQLGNTLANSFSSSLSNATVRPDSGSGSWSSGSGSWSSGSSGGGFSGGGGGGGGGGGW
jgi:uncharacterized membrane protein YgcG